MLVTILEYLCHTVLPILIFIPNLKYTKLIVKYINFFFLLGILKVTLVYVVIIMFGMNCIMGLSTYRGGSLQYII